MDRFSDQHYINRVIAGYSNEFAVLVDRYKNLVFTLAFRMIKDRQQAEEVCQDAFVKAYKSLYTFKGDSKFSTWIYKITYNTCLDHLKKFKKQKGAVYLEDLSGYELTAIENILDDIAEEEKNRKIQQSLDLLPAQDAFLLVLYYFDDLTIEEIAKVIGVNANNIKIRLFRSRKKLASILREQLAPEIIAYYENGNR
ncbi:RNA polymerase sigma factor [Dyadobacter sp. CY356]|uniref:RNA polymerase sigma factor n=1 Tax=Dyadobacter sp. CY356 TaxID=2906442 RepID=UPI001F3EEE97|nr:RNA polymerase sigma factor [Dyadobacter sp. CY356]MCF0055269.1 RNA polymerase sigma factor [Dyadobacter sp. CY356]